MRYVSTRGEGPVTGAEAISKGLAPDGGLYTPKSAPRLPAGWVGEMIPMDYASRAASVMKLFLDDFTQEELLGYARKAYGGFYSPRVAPLREAGGMHFLELWHGPTCAFKDMALQMLPYLLTASLRKTGERKKVCILVATSGDTGKAALEGFCDVPDTKILVFYPNNGVSKIQELQMTSQKGENVGVCAVRGNFDDAQTGVKAIFSDDALRAELSDRGWFFSSANSINWGRVLPQIAYYVSAYCDMVAGGAVKAGEPVNCCVPTGNFGNILSAWYAREIGVPIGRLICASNKNDVLTEFLNTGKYNSRREFFNTLSPSMDILVSSNLERLLYLLSGMNGEYIGGLMRELSEHGEYSVREDILGELKKFYWAGKLDDGGTRKVISRYFRENGYLMDTHTAVAAGVAEEYAAKTGDAAPMIVVSTASAYKFCDSVLDALGENFAADEGTGLIDRLVKATGINPPAPIEALKTAKARFTDVCSCEEMRAAALRMMM